MIQPGTSELLQSLLREAQRLQLSWQRPETFHIAKSNLVHGLRTLIASGKVAANSPPARVSAPIPAPVPALAPAFPVRIRPVSPAPPAAALTVTLSEAQFSRLIDLITRPNARRRRGFQTRLARWGTTIDMERRTVRLTADDVLWLRKMLINRSRGGYQWHLHAIFSGSCVHFTNLPIKPWPRRRQSQRRRRLRGT
jgi:hypothetical protein